MIKLGNIYHAEPLINHKPLDYINYKPIDNCMPPYLCIANADASVGHIPSLFVGWKKIRDNRLFGVDDVLNKYLGTTMWWEFSPSESIIQYSEGIEKFLKKVPHYYISNFKYFNADPFFLNLFTLKNIESLIPDGGDLYVYKEDMAYYRSNHKIYGFKLPVFSFIGLSSTDIINLLKSKAKNHLLDDSTEYQKYYRKFPDFPLLKRSMVVFLFS